MATLGDALKAPIWIRWRLHSSEGAVYLLDVRGSLVATARTTRSATRRNPLAAGLRAILPSGDRLAEHWDWDVVGSAHESGLATARRIEAPRGVRGSLDAVYEVSDSQSVVGTIGRAQWDDTRQLTSADGAVATFAVDRSRQPLFASAASGVDANGKVFAEIVPGFRSTEDAPADGVVSSLDARMLVGETASSSALLLFLFASLLDTHARDESASNRLGRREVAPATPTGNSYHAARDAERERTQATVHDRHVDDLATKARQRGNEELAQKLEQRRRRSR